MPTCFLCRRRHRQWRPSPGDVHLVLQLQHTHAHTYTHTCRLLQTLQRHVCKTVSTCACVLMLQQAAIAMVGVPSPQFFVPLLPNLQLWPSSKKPGAYFQLQTGIHPSSYLESWPPSSPGCPHHLLASAAN